MLEYIILPAGGGDFHLPAHRYDDVLRPNSLPSEPIEGYGTHSIDVDGCEVYFSDEQEGFQVVFECEEMPQEQTRRLVEEICANIERATGQKTVVILGKQ
jgi:hypothetical protein